MTTTKKIGVHEELQKISLEISKITEELKNKDLTTEARNELYYKSLLLRQQEAALMKA